ncbi:RNA polymerase sigma factor [Patescibacteria group bacterium]|nr:RNA polymerase sigma factor [Patescibacteria group bacterium]MCG2702748.1 RNA polymerase sigma factor [Candidatus Parcubacteria bacterium]MBU4265449.1 RNA polymerase sigma factor [Patescibacteria group bacterium]MBU4390499.1 RNA polymerase sigma factor [Patescibacteria group bacterium]MBU4396931.1 RNA polymerase sigma factor [Patescibacteria group bacterium]
MKEFYEKYYKSINGFVRKKVDKDEDVEELVNTILLAGWNSLPSFSRKSSEFSWLCGIAKHKIIDYYRKKKLKTVLFSAMPGIEGVAQKALGPEGNSLKNELKEEIKETFRRVSEGYRKILRLKYIDGLKVKEIAKKLEISVKAVESRLLRARRKFKKIHEENN